MDKVETIKHSFDFTPEDQEAMKRIVRFIAKTQGPTSRISAIRYALRKAVKGLPK